MKLKSAIAAAAAGVLLALSPQPASASVAINARTCAEPNGRVNAIALAGTLAYIGGDFTQVKDERGVWRARNRLAVFDTATCALLPWAPTANASVRALHYYGGVLYAGGDFTTMNGVARGRLASFTTSTGALRPFNPNPNRVVRAFAVAAGRLYIGGDFGAVGTIGRSGLAAFYLSNGALDAAWKPVSVGGVYALANDATRLYVGGMFTALAGSTYSARFGAVGLTSGLLDRAFLPRPSWPVHTIKVDSRAVYAAGGGTGGHLGIYNVNGTLQRPLFTTDGDIQGLAVDGDSLYVGGHFNNYCTGGTGSGTPFLCSLPVERRKALEISLSRGTVTKWAPVINSALGVFSTAVVPSTHQLWVGGDFTRINDRLVERLASFS